MPKLLITLRESDGNLIKIERDLVLPTLNSGLLKACNLPPAVDTDEELVQQAEFDLQMIRFDIRELVKIESVL
jgi:hypothetical protein